jgi:hypothetical protein
VGSCIGASREKARELGHENRKVARSEVASLGTSDLGSRRGSYSTSRVAKSRGSEIAIAWKSLIEVTGVDGSSHTCASESRCLGHRRLENQKFGIASSEVASSEILQGKVSELTDHRVSGIRGCSVQPLDSRSREFRSSEKLRKGIVRRRESVGRKIPDRELGEPLSSSGRGKRRSW